ncbi:MAG: tyrosine-type recombinase/integrase [Vicinamibacterales bacterium]
MFPTEHYGLSGDERKPHAATIDPTKPTREVKTAWNGAKRAAGVNCRFHDLRHTACTRMLERGVPLAVVSALLGWSADTTARMAKRYGHIGSEAQRRAVEALDFAAMREARDWVRELQDVKATTIDELGGKDQFGG